MDNTLEIEVGDFLWFTSDWESIEAQWLENIQGSRYGVRYTFFSVGESYDIELIPLSRPRY